MNKNFKCVGYFLILALTACSGVKVSSDYDPKASFNSLKNYAWLPDSKAADVADPVLVNEIMDKRIRKAINQRLTQQGFSQQNNTPDFYVNYSVLSEDKIDIKTYPSYGGYGPSWGWGPGYGYRGLAPVHASPVMTTREYRKGTLIIDVIDGQKKELLWRGLGSKRLPSSTDPEKLDKLVNLVVEKVLANFPPK